MRSRYSAFALGNGQYLLDTLSSDHGDREMDRAEYVRSLSSYKNVLKYMGLFILEAKGDEVLFYARMFESGRDVSFAELSRFVKEDGFWKYKDGIELHNANMPKEPQKLDRASFLALVAKQNEGLDLTDDA